MKIIIIKYIKIIQNTVKYIKYRKKVGPIHLKLILIKCIPIVITSAGKKIP